MSATNDELKAGTVGRFSLRVQRNDYQGDGFVRLGGDGRFEIELLAPTRNFPPDGMPEVMTGATGFGGMVLFDLQVANYTSGSGSRPAIWRFTAGIALLGVRLHRIEGADLRRIDAFIPGALRWAGVPGAVVETDSGSSGRPRGIKVAVSPREDLIAPIDRTIDLVLGQHWSLSGPDDDRSLITPLRVGVRATRPTSWRRLIPPLLAVQSLASLAYGGLVVAQWGTAEIPYSDGDTDMVAPRFWSSRLMALAPGGTVPRSMNEFPAFGLHTIGGIDGLRRWCQLSARHPRATGPLSAPLRFGSGYVETRLLEVAAGIEYWCKAHPSARWAMKPSGGSWALVLARRLGEPFAQLVGDPAAWAADFNQMYNRLKHRAGETYEGPHVRELADAGALLLLASLLNRARGDSAAGAELLNSHRYEHLRSASQSRYI